MSNHVGQWSEAHTAVLRAAWPDPKIRVRDIADTVDRSEYSVSTKAAKLGLGVKAGLTTVWTDDKVQKLKDLWAKGHSGAEIAALLRGVSRNAVIGKAIRLDLPPHSKESAAIGRQINAGGRRVGGPPAARAKPALKVNAGNQVVHEPEPRPVRSSPKAHAFDVLPGTAPQRFEDRPAHGCKWPVGEGEAIRACCEPSVRGGYCEPHATLCFAPVRPGSPRTANELARSLRRYVSR